MTRLLWLKRNLVCYGLFQALTLFMWMQTFWTDFADFLSSYLPIFPFWVLIATVRNYKRIQQNRDVTTLAYTCYLWVTLLICLVNVFLYGFLISVFGSTFRIAWTWKLRRQLQDYRHRLDLGKTDTI